MSSTENKEQVTYDYNSLGLSEEVVKNLQCLAKDCEWKSNYNVGSMNIGQALCALALSIGSGSNEEEESKKEFNESLKEFKSKDLSEFVSYAVKTLYPVDESEDLAEFSWRYTTGVVRVTRSDHRVFSTRIDAAVKTGLGLLINTLRNRLDYTSNKAKGPEDKKELFNQHREKCSKVLEELLKLGKSYQDNVRSKLPAREEGAEKKEFVPRSSGARFVKSSGGFDLKNLRVPEGYVAFVPMPSGGVRKFVKNPHASKFTSSKAEATD
jgi:hypothetical protein